LLPARVLLTAFVLSAALVPTYEHVRAVASVALPGCVGRVVAWNEIRPPAERRQK
jgi:hypothetical protein